MTSTNLKGMFNISFAKRKNIGRNAKSPVSVFSLETYSITEIYSVLPKRMPKEGVKQSC